MTEPRNAFEALVDIRVAWERLFMLLWGDDLVRFLNATAPPNRLTQESPTKLRDGAPARPETGESSTERT